MCACLPKFRKELLVECSSQIANSFRTARPSLSANHAFHHLDVVRPPEGEIFVVSNQSLSQLKLFITFFKVREYLQHYECTLNIATLSFFRGVRVVVGWS